MRSFRLRRRDVLGAMLLLLPLILLRFVLLVSLKVRLRLWPVKSGCGSEKLLFVLLLSGKVIGSLGYRIGEAFGSPG